ncbi:MAG: hypothetical protein IE890_00905 [Arcobacter sp.]|nr:hypothetical protein [Arcobacter sp.]
MKEIIIDKITEKTINTGLWKLDRGNKYLRCFLRKRKTPYNIVITKEIDEKFNSADWLYFDNLIKSMFNDEGRKYPKSNKNATGKKTTSNNEICIIHITRDEWIANADKIQKITGLKWRSGENLNDLKYIGHDFPVGIIVRKENMSYIPHTEVKDAKLIKYCNEKGLKYFLTLKDFLKVINNNPKRNIKAIAKKPISNAERNLMDFDKKIFIDSYKYNSMDPEKRGERDLNDYKKDLTEILNTFLLSKNKKEALKYFKEFEEKDWAKKCDLLSKHGKIASPMVTGPAKFPVAKNEKANATYRKAFEAYYAWRKKEINRIKKELGLNYEKPAEYGIKSGDPDAIQKLKNQIVKYENLIKDIKSGKEKVYSLSLARQYLNRYKKRLESLQNIKKQGDKKITKNNITFLDNTELMRYQLFFDEIPEKEIRDELKKAGFRWSPKNKSWQSYRNNKAMILINKLLGW